MFQNLLLLRNNIYTNFHNYKREYDGLWDSEEQIQKENSYNGLRLLFLSPPPHSLVDFLVLPPGHGSSVTDFWEWDAHEAQLRCPDDVSGDIGGWSARRALKPKFY